MRTLPFPIALLLSAACSSQAPATSSPKVIVYGDSISLATAQRRALGWPDELDRLLDGRGRDWTVVNRAINGNGLIWRTRCFGEPAMDRFRSDLPAMESSDTVILMAGVNDLIQPRLPAEFSTCFEPADLPASALFGPVARLRQQLRAPGSPRVLLATIPPFGRSEFHSDAAESARQQINRWIRAHWASGDLIDLDVVLGGGAHSTEIKPEYDSGDGLHPNSRGSAAIAAAVAERVR